MLIVNALFPNQVSFPYSKLCPLSHTLLKYISDLCFLYAFQSFKSINIFPDLPIFKIGLNRPFILLVVCHKFQPSNHLNVPLLDFLQSIHAPLVLWSLRMDTVLDEVSQEASREEWTVSLAWCLHSCPTTAGLCCGSTLLTYVENMNWTYASKLNYLNNSRQTFKIFPRNFQVSFISALERNSNKYFLKLLGNENENYHKIY